MNALAAQHSVLHGQNQAFSVFCGAARGELALSGVVIAGFGQKIGCLTEAKDIS